MGIKAAVLITKGLHCMHWHALVARSVVLALTLLMTQTTRYVSQVPFLESLAVIRVTGRAARTHIGRSCSCAAAGLGIQEITLETRQTDTRRSRPSAILVGPTAWFDPFL